MSVAGIDVGDNASCIAVCGKRGVQVLLNKESNRESPSIVSFGSRIRLIGTDAAPALSLNPRNTVGQLKRLLGKQFSDVKLQQELDKFPFKVVQGPYGKAAVEVRYMDALHTFLPEQLLAMIFVDLKSIMEKETGERTQEVVISCPAYYTETERHAVLAAASIADLKCLRLLNETTATAVSYAIFHHQELFDNKPFRVMIVDFGHQSLQVSVVALLKGQVQVLSHGWDRDLGGRDFEYVLVNHFANEFLQKYKLDVRTNGRSLHRLRMSCEKVKKVLSANKEATLNVECLMDDIDFHSKITREEFEELSTPLIARVRLPLERALKASGLTVDQLNSIEIVGGTCRIPAVTAVLTDFLGKEPSRTLHSKEVVSEGCAWQCALLSNKFRLNEVDVVDCMPYNMEASWTNGNGSVVNTMLFAAGSNVPSSKALLSSALSNCQLQLSYSSDAPLPAGCDRSIATIALSPPPQYNGYKVPVYKVTIDLSLNSTINVGAATQVEGTSLKSTDCVVKGADLDTKERGTPVPFQVIVNKCAPNDLEEMMKLEAKLAAEAREQEEAAEARNSVESLMFGVRNKMSGEHGKAMSDAERQKLTQVLDETEAWLADEGEDQPKSVYQVKLSALNQLNDALDYRLKATRGEAVPGSPAQPAAPPSANASTPVRNPSTPTSRPAASSPAPMHSTPTPSGVVPPPSTPVPPASSGAQQDAPPRVPSMASPMGAGTASTAAGVGMAPRPGSMAAMKAAAAAGRATGASPGPPSETAGPALSRTPSTNSTVTREPSTTSLDPNATGRPSSSGQQPGPSGPETASVARPPTPPPSAASSVNTDSAYSHPVASSATSTSSSFTSQATPVCAASATAPNTQQPSTATANPAPAASAQQPSAQKPEEPQGGRGASMNSLRTSSSSSMKHGSNPTTPLAVAGQQQSSGAMPQAAAVGGGQQPPAAASKMVSPGTARPQAPVAGAAQFSGMGPSMPPAGTAMPQAAAAPAASVYPMAGTQVAGMAMPQATASAPGMGPHMPALQQPGASPNMTGFVTTPPPQVPGMAGMQGYGYMPQAGMGVPPGYLPVMMNGQTYLMPAAAVQMQMAAAAMAQGGGGQVRYAEYGMAGVYGMQAAGMGYGMANQMLPGAGGMAGMGGMMPQAVPGAMPAAGYPPMGPWGGAGMQGGQVPQGMGGVGAPAAAAAYGMAPGVPQQPNLQGQVRPQKLEDPWASF